MTTRPLKVYVIQGRGQRDYADCQTALDRVPARLESLPFNFDRAISYPKPMQTPHPPILFGGATAQGRARVVEYCDGRIPIDVLLDDLPAAIADLRRKAEAAGRRPGDLSVSVFAFQPPTPDAVKRMQDMGVERVTLVAPRRLADALPFLDRMATLHASKR